LVVDVVPENPGQGCPGGLQVVVVVLRVGYSGSALVQPVDGYVRAETELDWCGHPGRVGGVPVAGEVAASAKYFPSAAGRPMTPCTDSKARKPRGGMSRTRAYAEVAVDRIAGGGRPRRARYVGGLPTRHASAAVPRV